MKTILVDANTFFYETAYPSKYCENARYETDILRISRKQLITEKLDDGSNKKIKTFKSEIPITADKVWVVFYYDSEDPSWASIEFVGNTLEEFNAWWKNYYLKIFGDELEDGEEIPTIEACYQTERSGLLMKEMQIE